MFLLVKRSFVVAVKIEQSMLSGDMLFLALAFEEDGVTIKDVMPIYCGPLEVGRTKEHIDKCKA